MKNKSIAVFAFVLSVAVLLTIFFVLPWGKGIGGSGGRVGRAPGGIVQIVRDVDSIETVATGLVLGKHEGKAYIYAYPPGKIYRSKIPAKPVGSAGKVFVVVDAGLPESRFVEAERYCESGALSNRFMKLPGPYRSQSYSRGDFAGEILTVAADLVPEPVRFCSGLEMQKGQTLGLVRFINQPGEGGHQTFERLNQGLKVTLRMDGEVKPAIGVERQTGNLIPGIVFDDKGRLYGNLDPDQPGEKPYPHERVEARCFDKIRLLSEGGFDNLKFEQASFEGGKLNGVVSGAIWYVGTPPADVVFDYEVGAAKGSASMKLVKDGLGDNGIGRQVWTAEISLAAETDLSSSNGHLICFFSRKGVDSPGLRAAFSIN